jgi:endonuclease YncB( thermonuclease family)
LINSRRNTDLNNCIINFKKLLKKRQPIYLVCLFLCLLLFLNSSPYANCKKLPITETVRYQTIFDGDTILLEDGRKVRLIGINTPEIGRKGKPSQPFAIKAKQKLTILLSKSPYLNLAYDLLKHDKYKRTLAYVYLPDGTDVQAEILSLGLATSIVIPPNEKNLNCYRKLEDKARQEYQGIWQLKNFKLINATDLTSKTKLYRFISGKVTSVKRKPHYIIIKLDHHLSIKLSAKAFLAYQFKQLLGRQIQVRGIVYSYRKKPGMSIYHPVNLTVIINSTSEPTTL